MNKLNKLEIVKISIVGANEYSDENEIREFLRKNPLAEIGFGVSDKSCKIGSERYNLIMSLLNSLPSRGEGKCRIGLHVNGIWSRYIAETGFLPIPIYNLVQNANGEISIQLNVIGSHFTFDGIDPENLRDAIDNLGEKETARFVIPYNPKSADFVNKLMKIRHRDFDILYDNSFGYQKVANEYYSYFPNEIQGYAGGLSPDNIPTQLDAINAVQTQRVKVYPDAEGGVRKEIFVPAFNTSVKTLDFDKGQKFYDGVEAWKAKNAETEQTHDQN